MKVLWSNVDWVYFDAHAAASGLTIPSTHGFWGTKNTRSRKEGGRLVFTAEISTTRLRLLLMLDFLLRLYYRLKQRRGMIMTESPTISYVRIKMQLFPQLQELLEVGDAGVTAVQEAVLAAVGIFIDKNCNWRQAPPPPPLTCGRTPLQRLKDLVKERAQTQPDTQSLFDYGFSQPDEEEVALAEQRGSLTMQV